MVTLFGLILFVFIIISLSLSWVLSTRLNSLREDLNRLTRQVAGLVSPTQEKSTEVLKERKKTTPTLPLESRVSLTKSEEPVRKKKVSAQDLRTTFEQKFALNLPVWIGGIALILGGVFLVKYSIETGLLTPLVRMVLGGILGFLFLLIGQWIHQKPSIANSGPISQALMGAGIADLYVCLFAATSLYGILPDVLGFAGMGLVTALAVGLSLEYGPPIALLGLLGGFLAPGLVGSTEPNAPLLFLYLYFVLAGLFTVIRKKEWWFLSIPTVIAVFLWVVFWLDRYFMSSDGLWLGLFLIAVTATIAISSKKALEEGESSKKSEVFPALNYLSMGGALLLMSAIAAKTNFSGMEWGLFGALTAGGIALAYFNQSYYGFIPWVALTLNVLMICAWSPVEPTIFTITLLGFALLYTLSSYGFLWTSKKSLPWAYLGGASALGYYLLGYAKYHNWIGTLFTPAEQWYTEPHLWSLIALGLFILSIVTITQILNANRWTEETKQKLLTLFTLMATAFLSIGITLELDKGFLTIALAAEILSISWINQYVHIKILRFIAGLLASLFGVLLVPQIFIQILLLSSSSSFLSLNEPPSATYPFFFNQLISALNEITPTLKWSFTHLGLPALMFSLSSFLLRRQKESRLIEVFEMIAIALITVLAYYLTRHGFHVDKRFLFAKPDLIEISVVSNIFFVFGLICVWIGRNFKRKAVVLSGIGLGGFALFRIALFDLLIYNPLWSPQDVGSIFFFNALLLFYGLPILWLIFAEKELVKIGKEHFLPYTNTILFFLSFIFVSFNIRQFYQGQYLNGDILSNAEIYTYSVVWLLMGILLLFFGVLKNNKTLRLASLAFLILTIGKVFLYDAAQLTGLLRVFSFLGLGISLLGLSWFYTRFVFKPSSRKEKSS